MKDSSFFHSLYCRYLQVFLFTVFTTACQGNREAIHPPSAVQEYTGHWNYLSGYDAAIEQVVITTPDNNFLTIHMKVDCTPGPCTWASQKVTKNSLETDQLELLWQHEGISIRQSLQIIAEGQLKILSEETYVDNTPTVTKEYLFVQNERKTFFQAVAREEALGANLERTNILGSGKESNRLTPGTVVLFKTNEGRYGKMQIRGNDAILTFRWETWEEDGTVFAANDYMETSANDFFDLNVGKQVSASSDCPGDFQLSEPKDNERWLVPQCEAGFMVYHDGT